jgi:hypothetical protein
MLKRPHFFRIEEIRVLENSLEMVQEKNYHLKMAQKVLINRELVAKINSSCSIKTKVKKEAVLNHKIKTRKE